MKGSHSHNISCSVKWPASYRSCLAELSPTSVVPNASAMEFGVGGRAVQRIQWPQQPASYLQELVSLGRSASCKHLVLVQTKICCTSDGSKAKAHICIHAPDLPQEFQSGMCRDAARSRAGLRKSLSLSTARAQSVSATTEAARGLPGRWACK